MMTTGNDSTSRRDNTLMRTTTSDDIIIRRYQDATDRAQTQACFAAAMMSNAPNLVREMAMSPWLVTPLLLGSTGLSILMAHRCSSPAIGLGVLVASTSAAYVAMQRFARREVQSFIDRSLAADLSRIDTVYKTPGVFLVATVPMTEATNNSDGGGDDVRRKRPATELIIGTVAAEHKPDMGKNVYELRRMSVHPRFGGRGLGRQLVQRLEHELSPASKVILTCSSVQYAAHGLYRKCGYQAQHRFTPPGMPILLQLTMQVWYWEKHFPDSPAGGIKAEADDAMMHDEDTSTITPETTFKL